MQDLKFILSKKITWLILLLVLAVGAFIPYYFLSTVDYQHNYELQIESRGSSYIKLHPKHSKGREIIVTYKPNGEVFVKSTVNNEVTSEQVIK